MFSGLTSPDLPCGLKSGDYIKAHENLENLVGDTSLLANLTAADAADDADTTDAFWCIMNARSEGPKGITVYAWTKAGISSCVMQPGHVGKAVASVPKNAKPIGFACVASMIIRSSPESIEGSIIKEPGAVERFFPTICNGALINAMQDCVDATWLSKLKDGGWGFPATLIERAERLYVKVKAENWDDLKFWDAYIDEILREEPKS